MGLPLQPGELVVKRIRWSVDADLMGIVIGHSAGAIDWLVMWTTDDRRVRFDWHLADALEVIEAHNVMKVRSRCAPAL